MLGIGGSLVVLAEITDLKTTSACSLYLSMTTIWRCSVHTLKCEHMNIQGEVCIKLSLIERKRK
jgi:hypothetical protein